MCRAFNDFSFAQIGGPWANLPAEARKQMSPSSLPVSELIQQTHFWLSTPVDLSPEWREQVAAAFSKVVSWGDRLAELARE